jgi:hypothetical protein
VIDVRHNRDVPKVTTGSKRRRRHRTRLASSAPADAEPATQAPQRAA